MKRTTNRLCEKWPRKDAMFGDLCRLYFSDKKRFDALRQRVQATLKKDKSEGALAWAGYISYLSEDFAAASRFFLDAVIMNPDNLDNWMDLAFSLRHLGEARMSQVILFHFDLVIHCYKRFKRPPDNMRQLKELLELIGSHAD